MPRKKLTLSLPEKTHRDLMNLQKAFGQLEPEETVATLVGLGMLGVSLTRADSPRVRITNYEDSSIESGYDFPVKTKKKKREQ